MVKLIVFFVSTIVCTICTVILEEKDSNLIGLGLFGTTASFMAMLFTALIEL